MGDSRLLHGQQKIMIISSWEIDGVRVDYTRHVTIRNLSPSGNVFIYGQKWPVNPKRLKDNI